MQLSGSTFETLFLTLPFEGGAICVRLEKSDDCYFVDSPSDQDIPYHGEGQTPEEAALDFREALIAMREVLSDAGELSEPMQLQKERLDQLLTPISSGPSLRGDASADTTSRISELLQPDPMDSSWLAI